MSGPAILLISYHFYPSSEIGARRPTALARFLAEKGIRVIVISSFGGGEVESESEIFPGVIAVPVSQPIMRLVDVIVKIKRRLRRAKFRAEERQRTTQASERGNRNLWTRMRDSAFRFIYLIDAHKRWGVRATRLAIMAGKKNSVRLVFSTSPPPTSLLVGASVARNLRIPHIVDFRDPWTDALSPGTFMDQVELKVLRRFEGRVLRAAAAVTSTGAKVLEKMASRYPEVMRKAHVIRNGYDMDIRREDPNTGGRLAILFAGELYLGRDPFPFLRALEWLLDQPEVEPWRVSVVLMGNVMSYRGISIVDWLAGKRSAEVVRILPPQPRETVARAIGDSTVVLNLAQNQRLSVPAKTFDHLASGRENLLICENDSETAELVKDISGVTRVDPDDDLALQEALLDLYRRHAMGGRLNTPSDCCVSLFSRAAANQKFWSVMSAVAVLVDEGGGPTSQRAGGHKT